MRPEHANTAEIAFYAPYQLRALLEAAEGPVRAMIALRAGWPMPLKNCSVDWAEMAGARAR